MPFARAGPLLFGVLRGATHASAVPLALVVTVCLLVTGLRRCPRRRPPPEGATRRMGARWKWPRMSSPRCGSACTDAVVISCMPNSTLGTPGYESLGPECLGCRG